MSLSEIIGYEYLPPFYSPWRTLCLAHFFYMLHPGRDSGELPLHFLYGKKIRERKEVKQLSQAQPDWQQGEIEVGSWCDRIDQQINCMVGNQVDTSTHLFLLRLWRQTVSQFQIYFHHLCGLIKSLSVSGPQFPPLILRIIKVLTSQSCPHM